NPGDVRLTQEAFKEAKILNNLNVVGDGVDAMAFLRREGRFAGVVRPDIVLLDLNLPRKSGRDVLEEIKGDPDLRNIPIVILTTSRAEQDVLNAYEHHANCYITKPVRLEQFVEIVRSISHFWLSIVELPAK
ncbi:MAG: response regulator, partial [Deltaproteobacteria bacterium]|nr:response regulator [Deltaproteobacteria bacterium]